MSRAAAELLRTVISSSSLGHDSSWLAGDRPFHDGSFGERWRNYPRRPPESQSPGASGNRMPDRPSMRQYGVESMITAEKQFALDWVDDNRQDLSDWNQIIWHYAETALREYKSAAWYVERLRAEGFEVEAGSGVMPTAIVA